MLTRLAPGAAGAEVGFENIKQHKSRAKPYIILRENLKRLSFKLTYEVKERSSTPGTSAVVAFVRRPPVQRCTHKRLVCGSHESTAVHFHQQYYTAVTRLRTCSARVTSTRTMRSGRRQQHERHQQPHHQPSHGRLRVLLHHPHFSMECSSPLSNRIKMKILPPSSFISSVCRRYVIYCHMHSPTLNPYSAIKRISLVINCSDL